MEKNIKLCKVVLNYNVEYYIAANDNKSETAIDNARKNLDFKLKETLGDTFDFVNAYVKSEKQISYKVEEEVSKSEELVEVLKP